MGLITRLKTTAHLWGQRTKLILGLRFKVKLDKLIMMKKILPDKVIDWIKEH
jgi:hypothetical protein